MHIQHKRGTTAKVAAFKDGLRPAKSNHFLKETHHEIRPY